MADTIKPKDLQPTQPQEQKKPLGTGFTNIQKLIGANQGNKLGSSVVGGIQKAGQQVGNQVASSSQDYNRQLQQNSMGGSQDQTNANNLVNKATSGNDVSDADVQQAQKYASGQYTGPTELNNSSQIINQARNVEQLGKLGSSAGGRQGLLQRFIGAPQYTQGQQRLDSLLLGADNGAINQARGATQGLTANAQRAIDASRAQGDQATQQASQFGQQFQKTLTDKTSGINTDVNSRLKAAQDANTANQSSFNQLGTALQAAYAPGSGIGTGETPDSKALAAIMNSTGLSPDIKGQLSNIVQKSAAVGANPLSAINNLLKYGQAQNLNNAGITSSQQAASLNALAKLSGQPTTDYGTVGNYQAGGVGYKTPDSLLQTQGELGKLGNINKTNLSAAANGTAFGNSQQRSDTLNALNKMFTPAETATLKAMPLTKQGDYVTQLQKKYAQQYLDEMNKYEGGNF